MSQTIRNRIVSVFETGKVKFGSSSGTRQSLASSVLTSDKFRGKFESIEAGHRALITHQGLANLLEGISSSTTDAITSKVLKAVLGDPEKFYNGLLDFLDSKRVAGKRLADIPGAINPLISSDFEEIGTSLNIAQSDQKKFFMEYFNTSLGPAMDSVMPANSKNKTKKIREISAFVNERINAGHLAGLLSSKAALAFGGKVSIIGNLYRDIQIDFGTNEKSTDFEHQIQNVLKLLLDADFLTSSAISNQELMVTAVKEALGDNPKFSTELQFSKSNQDSGKILGAVGSKLNEIIRLFSGVATKQYNLTEQQAYQGFLLSLKPVLQLVKSLATEQSKGAISPDDIKLYKSILADAKTSEAFIETPGSVSIKNGIAQNIVNIIKTGKAVPKVVTKTVNRSTVEDPNNKVLNKLNKYLKTVSQELTKAKKAASAGKAAQQKTPVGPSTKGVSRRKSTKLNLANLQALLNQALPQQIKQNMGTPALNNRTGRFAESVKVQNISESRAGMISMFYSYMKSPYQTFSQGGKQYTTAREPKTLISKSIREIASGLVGNRLRAISL